MGKIMQQKKIGKNANVILQRQRDKYGGGWEYAVFGRRKLKSRDGQVYESEAYYHRGENALKDAQAQVKDIRDLTDFEISFPALRDK